VAEYGYFWLWADGYLCPSGGDCLEANEVFAVELAPPRLELAHQCVPSAVLINPKQVDKVDAIMEASGGWGVDVCLEYCGSGQALKQALKAVK
jgi:threonine dehydrogenase-like Zn-dependent dehydrogenase